MRSTTRLRAVHTGRSGSVLPQTIRSRLNPHPSEGQVGRETEQGTVNVNGWLKSVRGHKNVVFAEVTDGSSSEGLQAVFKGDSRVPGLDAGAAVRLTGRVVGSKGSRQTKELLVDSTEILGACDPEVYPIQKKHLPPPVLRDIAHLRFRTTQTSSIMRIRDGMMREWHDWFEDTEFIHVHTPLLTSSDCEGAGETFGIIAPTSRPSSSISIPKIEDNAQKEITESTTSPANSASNYSAQGASSQTPTPFFPSPVNLTVSSQLHLEAPTHSLSRTYTLSPAFRAEPSLTSRHLCEFYMLEGEVVLDTLDELMDVVEDGIRSVLTRMLENEGKRGENMRRDLKRLAKEDSEVKGDGLDFLTSTARTVFHRMTYTNAIEELLQRHQESPFETIPNWSEGLPTEQEKYLAGRYGPTFITHYPKHLKPFYMLPSIADKSYAQPQSKGETVSCFDLLFPGIGELAGGSMREHRLSELEIAIDAHWLDRERYGWYLDLRRFGSVPHGGWGMGWDRWISWVTGVGNLRDVVAFPRWKGNCRY